jgi:hypothetical protein
MTKSVAWSYGYARPKGGNNRLVKEFILFKNDARVFVTLFAYNHNSKSNKTAIRTHSLFNVGGDADVSDMWVVPVKNRNEIIPYPFAKLIKNPLGWTAICDTSKKQSLICEFSESDFNIAYTCGANGKPYDLELWTPIKNIESKKAIKASYTVGIVKGMKGIYSQKNAKCLNINLNTKGIISNFKPLELKAEIGSFVYCKGSMVFNLIKEGKVIKAMLEKEIALIPAKAICFPVTLNHSDLKDGKYELELIFNKKGKKERLVTHKTIQISRGIQAKRIRELKKYEDELSNKILSYKKLKANPDTWSNVLLIRKNITSLALLIDMVKMAIKENDNKKFQFYNNKFINE